MSWKLEIERVSNGLILRDEEDETTEVYTFDESDDNVATAGQHAIWSLMEKLDLTGSRYDKDRLRIRVEPGDKYTDVPYN